MQLGHEGRCRTADTSHRFRRPFDARGCAPSSVDRAQDPCILRLDSCLHLLHHNLTSCLYIIYGDEQENLSQRAWSTERERHGHVAHPPCFRRHGRTESGQVRRLFSAWISQHADGSTSFSPSRTARSSRPRPPRRRRLGDKTLPVSLTGNPAFAADSKMYQDLLDIERRLDWQMMRKKAEIQDTVGRPLTVRPPSRPSEACALTPADVRLRARSACSCRIPSLDRHGRRAVRQASKARA
jgi:hypothetical protein